MAKLLSNLAALLLLMTSLSPMTSLAREYVAEVKIYVDQSGYQHWKKVSGKSELQDFQREMNSTVFEINQIFKTLEKYDVSLQLQISDLVVLDSDLYHTTNGKMVHIEAMDKFLQWITPQYAGSPYDLAILFTGANLVRENMADTTYGYGKIAAVCSANGLAVIEIHSTYYDVLAATHELGHIFGSNHDGDSGARGCKSGTGFIMDAFTLPASINHFYFSSCSANQIKGMIDRLNARGSNCMTSWNRNGHLTGPRYASLLSKPGDICRRRFGPKSYIARKPYSSYGDNICSQLACMTKTVKRNFYWNFVPTPQGLKCGKNKQCIQGQCVVTSTGSPDVSDSCPFGDQPKIEGEYQMKCSDIQSSYCQYWNNTCCQTCTNDPGTADEVCKQLQGSTSSMARRAYHNDYDTKLCSKLACLTSTTGTYFRWNYYTAPDGMKCGKNKRCSNGKCIVSNHGDPNMSNSCPYGDQPFLEGDWQSTCSVQVNHNGCNGWLETCCQSCPS